MSSTNDPNHKDLNSTNIFHGYVKFNEIRIGEEEKTYIKVNRIYGSYERIILENHMQPFFI